MLKFFEFKFKLLPEFKVPEFEVRIVELIVKLPCADKVPELSKLFEAVIIKLSVVDPK